MQIIAATTTWTFFFTSAMLALIIADGDFLQTKFTKHDYSLLGFPPNGLRYPRAGFAEPLLFLERLFSADFRASGERCVRCALCGIKSINGLDIFSFENLPFVITTVYLGKELSSCMTEINLPIKTSPLLFTVSTSSPMFIFQTTFLLFFAYF